jgi:hypothetical protein
VNFSIIPIGSILLCFSLVLVHVPCVRLVFSAQGPNPKYVRTQSAVPSVNSSKLRAALLTKATTHLSPKWKNPGISEYGLDSAIVTTLQQQATYLHSTGAIASPSPAAPSFGVSPALSCDIALIRSVNGKATGAIFTPKMPNDSYRIEGCLFGNIRGEVDLEPHPPDPTLRIPTIPLTLDTAGSSWSNTRIEAHLDPHLSGIPDVPVTLVIHLAEGRRLELPGCFFVASRSDPKLLASIPASWISLQPSSIRSRSIERLEYVSPPMGSGVPADSTGTSAFVSRLDAEKFDVDADLYDFSHLNPGWVVDSVQLQTYAVACPGASLSRQSSGHWDTQWNGRKLTVQLQDDVCTSRVSPSFTFNLSVSQYALKVWVVGPVGTKPLADALLHDRNRSLTQTN